MKRKLTIITALLIAFAAGCGGGGPEQALRDWSEQTGANAVVDGDKITCKQFEHPGGTAYRCRVAYDHGPNGPGWQEYELIDFNGSGDYHVYPAGESS
jgi:hypothetical protein